MYKERGRERTGRRGGRSTYIGIGIRGEGGAKAARAPHISWNNDVTPKGLVLAQHRLATRARVMA